jgi:hypothetical protein
VRHFRLQTKTAARATSALLAAALFAGPLFESAHQAKVQHVACPEDGELIDAPVQAAHHHKSFAGTRGLFAESDPAAPQPSGSDHDHCAVALRGHLRARETEAQQLSLPLEVAVFTSRIPALPVLFRSVALYRLAPKSGPPQA